MKGLIRSAPGLHAHLKTALHPQNHTVPDHRSQLQARVGKVDDADLRNLLLAPLANEWLQLDDLTRTSHLVQLAGAASLARVHFHDHLRARVGEVFRLADVAALPDYKSLTLDLALLTPLKRHSDELETTIDSWILLRTKELATLAGPTAQGSYLERLVSWTLSAS
jgi:hypothetical protein